MTDVAEEDPRMAGRRTRADRYFKEHLGNQREWYSRRASVQRKRAQTLSFIVIVPGLTAFIQVFHREGGLVAGMHWSVIATGILSLSVVAAEGPARIGRFQEAWLGYRKAAEQMKREYRLYINGAGDYAELSDEDASYRAFVANIEQIIAEEQELYWRGLGRDMTQPPKSDAGSSG